MFNQINFNQIWYETLWPWLVAHVPAVLIILIFAYITNRILDKVLDKIVRRLVTPDSVGGSRVPERKREETLVTVIGTTLHVGVWVVAVFMVLSEVGLDIGPLMATAGVAGLALGFGGQYLIKDIISGLFIILENQYRVGDIVCIGNVCGAVEHVNLRLTVLRDLDGVVHHIPNGSITVASNKSKGFSKVNFNIGVSYDSDIEKVIEVINQVGLDLAKDEKWSKVIKKAPEFARIDAFADSAVMMKILADVEAGEQWSVAGELRRRLKKAFDQNGIVIPFPQVVVHEKKKR